MGQGYIDPDYIDVNERLKLFYGLYPDGRLVTTHWSVEHAGDRLFAVCQARAYRTPDDPMPSSGTAWEPIPGPTPFTRDSELMNAETAAWGRAIVAAGIPAKKIATRQDVQARQETPVALPDKPVTKAQHGKIGVLVKELMDISAKDPDSQADWVGASREFCLSRFGKHSRAELTTVEAGQLIDWLEEQVVIAGVPFG